MLQIPNCRAPGRKVYDIGLRVLNVKKTVEIPRALEQGLVGVWRLYHFPVVPTQGAIPGKGKYKKNSNLTHFSIFKEIKTRRNDQRHHTPTLKNKISILLSENVH